MRMAHRIAFTFALAAATLLAASASAQQRGRGFGFGRGGPPDLVTIATNEAVQKELGLSADVVGKLTALRDESRAARTKEYTAANIDLQNFQNLTDADRRKMAEIGTKISNEFSPKVKDLVTAAQLKRMREIQIQASGIDALTDADVAKELAVTDEQKKRIADLKAEYERKQNELPRDGDFQERFAKIRELNTERDNKAVEVLTPEQKTKFTALKGSPFDVSQLGFGGRGRRGN